MAENAVAREGKTHTDDELFTIAKRRDSSNGDLRPPTRVSTFSVQHHPVLQLTDAPPHLRRGALEGCPPDSGGRGGLATGWLSERRPASGLKHKNVETQEGGLRPPKVRRSEGAATSVRCYFILQSSVDTWRLLCARRELAFCFPGKPFVKPRLPLALLFLALALWPGCSKKEAEVAPVVTVQVATAETEKIERKISADAVIYPLRQAALVPKISAPVHKFFVERGSHVHADELACPARGPGPCRRRNR